MGAFRWPPTHLLAKTTILLKGHTNSRATARADYILNWDIPKWDASLRYSEHTRHPLARSTFSPRYQAFLVNLRQAREEAGLTQVEVAQALGKPQSFVSKCESGERRVDVIELADFARLYRKSVDHFIPESPPTP